MTKAGGILSIHHLTAPSWNVVGSEMSCLATESDI
jgi:hypothetical protein